MSYLVGRQCSFNNISWNIKFVDPGSRVLKRNNGALSLGVTDAKARTIYISDVLRNKLKSKVLLHELCHACMYSYGIIIPIETEEFICDFVANHAIEIVDALNGMFDNIQDAMYI